MLLSSVKLIPLNVVFIFSHSVHSLVSPNLKTVEVGGCVDVSNDELVHCAAFAEECEGRKTGTIRFKSSLELETFFDNINECTTKDIPLGTCKKTGKCAITNSTCLDPTDFAPAEANDKCNAEGHIVNDIFVPTQYGGCKDGTTGEIFCALTPADCSFREAWIPASAIEEYLVGGCRCQ